MTNIYPAMVAWDTAANRTVPNAVFQVYSVTDTGFTTPLAITDPFGVAIPNNQLNSGTLGIVPEFGQATYQTVVVSDIAHVYAWTILCIQPPTQDGTVAGFITSSTSATAAALRSNFAGVWKASTAYTLGQAVVSPSGDIVTAKANFTSGGTYNASNWNLSTSYIPASAKGAASGVATLDSSGLVPVAQLPSSAADYGYLYLGFPGNGTYLEKAQVLYSATGTSVVSGSNNPVYTDPNTGASFRDPSVLKIGSTWFSAYTVNNGLSKNFAVIKSTDLVNWTQVVLVDVSAATSINQAWAPELIQDTNGDVYAFFTNVTAASAQSIWYVKATDPTGLTTWGAPVAITWATNPGNIWDATMIQKGGVWYMFYAYNGYVQRANCATLTGTWTTDQTGDWAGWVAGMPANTHLEAPELVQVTGSKWRIYFDPYIGTSAPYTQPGYYYSESTDFTTWTTPALVAKPPSFPVGSVLRHGAWVKLADDTSRNTALASCEGRAQLQHVEFSGSFSITTGTVTAVTGQTITTNSNHDQFVTNDGSGKFTFVGAGEYCINADFTFTSGTGVTRSFAQMSNNTNTVIYERTPGGAEDHFQLNIPTFKATAGLQVLLQAFGAFTGTGTLQANIRITRTSW